MIASEITDAVCMMLWQWGIRPIREYRLPNGRRLDVAALCKSGRLLGVEVKTSASDFNRDLKWADAMSQCFLFYFAVPTDFPVSIIHPGIRIISVDAGRAWISRKTGAGLHAPSKWHEASGRYAVNPAAGVDPTVNKRSGDSATGRLILP